MKNCNKLDNLTELYQIILKNDFYSFLTKAFEELNPGKKLIKSLYTDLIIDHLEKMKNNDLQRLIINLPPRSLKSVIVSVAWPAWLLGVNPALKIIVVSYAKDLSIKHSQDTRLIMNSEWYKKLFPNTRICQYQNSNNKFITTEKGFRLATSTNSALTGEGADVIIIDDPSNAIDSYSKSKLEKTNNWFEQSLVSRLNDRQNGKIILVMQRLNVNDLSGHLLKQKAANWQLLKLPLIAPQDLELPFKNKYLNIKKGEILNPKFYDKDLVNRLKNEIGTKIFNSQYQQEPLKEGSNILEYSHLSFYDKLPVDKEFTVISLDSAVKENENNDFSAFTIWQVSQDNVYLVFAIKKRLNFPDLKDFFIRLCNNYSANLAIIEDKASGSSLIQELRNLSIKIIPFQTRLNKIARLDISLMSFSQKRVFFPANAPWMEDYIEELLNFPNHRFDDFVDSTTQFICYWQKNYKKTVKISFV